MHIAYICLSNILLIFDFHSYLSIAITCHPINRDRFVGSSDIATMLDSLFLNLPELNNDTMIMDFIEEAISTAVRFM